MKNKTLLALWEILVFSSLFAALPYSGYSYLKILSVTAKDLDLVAKNEAAKNTIDELTDQNKALQSKLAALQPVGVKQNLVDPSPAPSPGPGEAPPQLRKAWVGPWSIPAQDHWYWLTSDGKTYQDVKILKIEADAVTIVHSSGGALVVTSTLPPDIQKQLHYDPDLAKEAENERAKTNQYSNDEIAKERILSYQQALVARNKDDFARFSKMLIGRVGERIPDGYMVTVNAGPDVPINEYPSGTYHLVTALTYTGDINLRVYGIDAGTTCSDDLDYAFTHRQHP